MMYRSALEALLTQSHHIVDLRVIAQRKHDFPDCATTFKDVKALVLGAQKVGPCAHA